KSEMSETEVAGTSGTGGLVDDTSAAVVQEFKDRAFDAMAKNRRVRLHCREKGPGCGRIWPQIDSPSRKNARAVRFRTLLSAQITMPGLSDAYQAAVSESSEADLRAREHETIRATAQYEMRDAVERGPVRRGFL